MPIAKGLLLKGFAGVTVCAGTAGGVIFRKEIAYAIYGADTVTNNKLDTLSLPESCYLHNKQNQKKCFLVLEELKKVKFKDIDGDNITVEGLDTSEIITLVIEKVEDKTIFTDGLKFTFKDYEKEIKIKKDSTNETKLIKNTNPEFKINSDKLEKAWTADSLAKKAGLKCCDSGTKKCTINTTGLKFSDNGTAIKDLTLDNEDANKITYEEDKEGYNQGFKFNVSAEVTGTGTSSGVSLQNGDYEIKYDKKVWYLSKKQTADAA